MSLEMAHKVILPPKKNYIPQFLKQRDINSYWIRGRDINMKKKEGYIPLERRRNVYLEKREVYMYPWKEKGK
jgi:hypothetical protein